jgi:hypothetical protein
MTLPDIPDNDDRRWLPEYCYRIKPEMVWFVVTAALTPLLVTLSTLDPSTITDWRVWGVGVGAAMVRALAAAILAQIGPGGFARD